MTQDFITKRLGRNSSDSTAPEQKRLRFSPPMLLHVSAPMSSSLPPLPPLKNFSRQNPAASTAPDRASAASNAHKLAELRRKYLDDITMVTQELNTVLTYGPGSACPDSPVPPSVVLKLVRTVQTLEKLHALLLMNPARLRRVSMAQLETVEQQLKMNLLPLATLFRSFDGEKEAVKGQHRARTAYSSGVSKMEQDWSQYRDANSPRSPSGVSVAAVPRHDWRFLSMALSLQL